MSIKITPKQDYSSLFSSLGAKDPLGTSSLLTDYASIKNGSYGKLLKAYYTSAKSSDVKSSTAAPNKAEVKEAASLSSVKSSALNLKDAVTSLSSKVYEKAEREVIADAVKDFANSYNQFVKDAGATANESVKKQAVSMVDNTFINSNLLKSAGITINEDNTLSVDMDKFKAADDSTVKTLFASAGSLADRIGAQAGMIGNFAGSALSYGSLYNDDATSAPKSTYIGSLFDSLN